jgi:phage tail sheath protein FI
MSFANFVGRGPGARTLGGNRHDYWYVPVRRTAIYLERPIMAEMNPFVFAANDTRHGCRSSRSVSNRFPTSCRTYGREVWRA